MFEIRKAQDRGNAKQGAITSYFSFSFEEYYHDEKHVNFGPLIALNEDYIAPGQGFDLHSHDNIEIFTYMMHGELSQDDADGRHSVNRRRRGATHQRGIGRQPLRRQRPQRDRAFAPDLAEAECSRRQAALR